MARGWTQAELAEQTALAARQERSFSSTAREGTRSGSLRAQRAASFDDGLSIDAIQRIETGKRRPRARTIATLALALRLTNAETSGLRDSLLHIEAAHNIPFYEFTIVGRDSDLQAVLALLRLHRLVCITGAAGVGKTCLTIHAAKCFAEATPPADGVWFIDLRSAPPSETNVAAFIEYTLRGDLRFDSRGHVRHDEDALEFLANRHLLLVLDNCDAVVQAVRVVALQILERYPQVNMLLASRERTGIASERVLRLRALSDDSAATLLLDRIRGADLRLREARALMPTVRRICRRVDKLPAAIERVADWSELLSLKDLERRLPHLLVAHSSVAHSRDATMRGSLDLSYQLLTEREKRFITRLVAFRGRFSPAMAAEVSGEEPESALHILRRLVRKSLVESEVGVASQLRLTHLQREYVLTLSKVRSDRAQEP